MRSPGRILLPLLLAAAGTVGAARGAEPAAPPAPPLTVAVLVLPHSSLLDLAGPAEVFAAVHGERGAAFRVVTVGPDREPVDSSVELALTPRYSLDEAPPADVIVVPGGPTPPRLDEVTAWLRAAAQDARFVLSVSTGAMLLAEAGLLDGEEATANRGNAGDLQVAAPEARVVVNRRFCASGKVVTASEVATGMEAALHVVGRLLGDEVAQRTARDHLRYPWDPEAARRMLAAPPEPVELAGRQRVYLALRDRGAEAARELLATLPTEERPQAHELGWIGIGLLRRGRVDEAAQLGRFTVAAFPDSPDAHLRLAQALLQQGKDLAAAEQARTARRLLEEGAEVPGWALESLRSGIADVLAAAGSG